MIILSKNNIEIEIDEDMYDIISKYNWSIDQRGYARTYMKGETILMHRMIMGVLNEKKVVDHIDGNKLNNKRENLRVCSQLQNTMNRKKNTRNSTGYTGVCFNKKANKYVANLNYNHRRIYLGLFETIEEAVEARKKAELFYRAEFNRD